MVRVCDRQCKTPGVTSWISGRRLRRRGILNWQASNMGFSFTNVPKCNAGMRWLSGCQSIHSARLHLELFAALLPRLPTFTGAWHRWLGCWKGQSSKSRAGRFC